MNDGFSPDGYIVDQRKTGMFRYGVFPSPYNGCGWIAVYNFLRAEGDARFPGEVIERLVPMLRLGGMAGTRVHHICACLQSFGYDSSVVKGHDDVLAAMGKAERGILWLMDGAAPHFAAFTRVSTVGRPPMLRFFNADAGNVMHLLSPEEMVGNRRYLTLITARRRDGGGTVPRLETM